MTLRSRTLPTIRQIVRSASFYPISGLWCGGALLGMAWTQQWLDWKTALVLFALFAIGALIFAAWKELEAVHKLVDGQRTELLGRIDELVGLLVRQGVVVPPSGEREQDARDDVRRAHNRQQFNDGSHR